MLLCPLTQQADAGGEGSHQIGADHSRYEMSRALGCAPRRDITHNGFACIVACIGALLGSRDTAPRLKLTSALLAVSMHVCALSIRQARLEDILHNVNIREV